MKSLIQNKLIELHRVRFEHFYNGVLTFDIHYCTYDCLFCFSKEGRNIVKKNLKNKTIKRVNLDNLFFGEEYKEYHRNRVNFNQNSMKYKDCFNLNFGNSEYDNNLILKKITGDIVIETTVNQLIEKIQYILKLIKSPIKSVRFSGGDIVNSDYLDWFNDFIEKFIEKYGEKLILIIETNGSRYNTNQEDPVYNKFLKIIGKQENKRRIHIRISLKNPNDAFYKVLTKKGDKSKLYNAIDFGLYCLRKDIDFHYTIFANYLSIDDLIKFRKIIIQKLKTIENEVYHQGFKSIEAAFDKIFKSIEYERLFYYKIVFLEYLHAYDLLKGDIELRNKLNQINLKLNLEQNLNNREKAYYLRFLNRTVPKFKKNSFNIFEADLIQHKKLLDLYSRNNQNLKVEIENEESIIFEGYKGILDFWELLFGSRFLIFRPNEKKFSSNLRFQNISIVNRVPLYPGIFYLFDFWAQSRPNYFIYTLYAERKCFSIDNGKSYIFSLNSNPDTHAHTDISRAIPIIIDSTKSENKALINDLNKNNVIDINYVDLKIKEITSYNVNFEDFNINVPFYVLEFLTVDYDKNNKKKTPFLGSIGALYDNLWIHKDFFAYLNYFTWTGLDSTDQIKASIKKAIDYLYDFQNLSEENQENFKWLDLKILEPKDEIFESIGLKKKFIRLLDNQDFKELLGELSEKNIEKIKKAFNFGEKV